MAQGHNSKAGKENIWGLEEEKKMTVQVICVSEHTKLLQGQKGKVEGLIADRT